ncbi:conserved hypothetical protein [Aeromonas phage 65]|uniref:Uncharacterized protein n=2 Tax=Ishigurovirus osborne TaxID=260149 RepID=A0A219YBZ8_9CAUD|nr:starvation-inducible transcriptional regulator [Aeromonas phage 65]ADQ53148.1 conserved hypothetical protein [Aeromonas phage 65]APU01526.1 hypothetical protein [Aeromonas phage 65.2]
MKIAYKYDIKRISDRVSQFVTVGLKTVAKIHYLHLVTSNYALHMALDEFYKEFPDDYLDGVAESALANDITLSYVPFEVSGEDALEVLQKLYDTGIELVSILEGKPEFKGTLNAVEDSLEFIKKVIYKVKRFN